MISLLALACVEPSASDSAAPVPAPAAELPAWLELAEPVTCDAPAPLAYRDVGAAWGLTGLADPDGDHGNGGGAAVWDVEGDGDLDVVLAYPEVPPVLFRQTGGVLVGEPLAGLTGPSAWAALGDTDGDGDLDLFVGEQSTLARLLRNDGGTLVADTTWLPADMPRDGIFGVAPGDPDADGDLDLYLPLYQGNGTARADALIRDDGAARTAVTLPAAEGAKTYQALWFDADGDGDQDAYATNDMGPQAGGNTLFRNDGGELSPVACDCAPATSGMSADAADVDGDGHADLYLGNSDWANLYLSDGAGGFYDAAEALGALNAVAAGDPEMVWGVALFDAENDGDVDIFAARGDLWLEHDTFSQKADAADSLLLQGDDGRFTEVAPALGLDDRASSRAVVPADFNGDGVLDLLVTGVVTDPHLWLSEGCTAGAWLQVELVGGGGAQAQGLGARVEVEAGGRTVTSWVTSGASIFSGRAPWVHVGLGEAATVDRVTVTWPDGAESSTEVPFAPRRRVVVRREGE